MSGTVHCWSRRSSAAAYRKRCPTSLDFLRDMASVKDWHPDCRERFAEAADELERLQAGNQSPERRCEVMRGLYGVDRFTCPATGKTADLPHGSTCAPKHALECPSNAWQEIPMDDPPYPECQTCDLVHHYEVISSAQLKRERAIKVPKGGEK